MSSCCRQACARGMRPPKSAAATGISLFLATSYEDVGAKQRCGGQPCGVTGLPRISPGWLQQLLQLLEQFGILRAGGRVVATRIRSLQSANHRACNREGGATMIGFAHKIPLRGGWNVTVKAAPAKPIDHIGGPSFANLCSVFRHVELEELPIMRCSVEALVALDHGLAWNQLNDRSRWIHGARGRIGGGQRRVEIALQVVHVELTDRRHLRDTAE